MTTIDNRIVEMYDGIICTGVNPHFCLQRCENLSQDGIVAILTSYTFSQDSDKAIALMAKLNELTLSAIIPLPGKDGDEGYLLHLYTRSQRWLPEDIVTQISTGKMSAFQSAAMTLNLMGVHPDRMAEVHGILSTVLHIGVGHLAILPYRECSVDDYKVLCQLCAAKLAFVSHERWKWEVGDAMEKMIRVHIDEGNHIDMSVAVSLTMQELGLSNSYGFQMLRTSRMIPPQRRNYDDLWSEYRDLARKKE